MQTHKHVESSSLHDCVMNSLVSILVFKTNRGKHVCTMHCLRDCMYIYIKGRARSSLVPSFNLYYS